MAGSSPAMTMRGAIVTAMTTNGRVPAVSPHDPSSPATRHETISGPFNTSASARAEPLALLKRTSRAERDAVQRVLRNRDGQAGGVVQHLIQPEQQCAA